MAEVTLETFSASDFNVANLVDALTEDNVRRAKAEGGGAPSLSLPFELGLTLLGSAFDSRPLIQTLEQTLAQLLPLRKANAAKTAELERSVAAAERAYRGDVRGAKAGFEVRPCHFCWILSTLAY